MERYLQLAVALGERDPDALDFYAGSERLVATTRHDPPKLDAIAGEAHALEREIDASHLGTARIDFLKAQLNAIAFRVKALQGAAAGFDDESRAYFGLTAPADTEFSERASTRAEIAQSIGTSSIRYADYDRRFLVPPAKVPAVMEAALKTCREKTLKHVSLPVGESVDVKYVVHKPWSAFSRYLGNAHSVIEVNLEYPLTVDRILDLACHEGYPGHHVFNTQRDLALVRDKGQQEAMVQLTFSPQSFISEAAASYAPEMVFNEAERVQLERDVLFPIAGFDAKDAAHYVHIERLVERLHTAMPGIAREYLDGRLEFVRASDALERETLMPHAEATLIYLNEYRSYMLTYTLGKDAVERWVDGGGKATETRWDRYLALMRDPALRLDIVR